MPVIANSRPHLSEVLLATSMFQSDSGVDYHFERVTVHAAANTKVSPLGTPVVWNATNDRFELLADGYTIPAEDSTLPNGAPVAIAVGAAQGVGFNKDDVTVTAAGTELTVLFRGAAAIVGDAIAYASGVQAATKAVFEKQLEKQGVAVKAAAQDVVPSFI